MLKKIDRIRRISLVVIGEILWFADSIAWRLPRPLRSIIIGDTKEQLGITVTVSTYIERFDTCFKPILNRLSQLFPTEQIIVVANGHYDTNRQLPYLGKLRSFCSLLPMVDLYDFVEPVCISKMTNTSMLNSHYPKSVILNEDLRVSILFRRFLKKSGILRERIAIINRSWCHVVISTDLFRQVGFFDERLPEMGGEDDDYAARCAITGIQVRNYTTRRIGQNKRTYRSRDKLNSWGRDMTKQIAGYSSLNHSFLLGEKWETSSDPFEGAVFVPNRTPKYWKLRPGMETPDFYPESGFLKKNQDI